MKVDLSDGFADEVATLTDRFTSAAVALESGNLKQLQLALQGIVKVATVLLTVLAALDKAKSRK